MTKINTTSETEEISIRLESFDDIFSDFDMRGFDKRALSVDFLDEIKRASLDKDESGIELALYAPEKERDESKEGTIKERLSAHFNRHYGLVLKERVAHGLLRGCGYDRRYIYRFRRPDGESFPFFPRRIP